MEFIVTSILAFSATNIDDLFLLTLFFGNYQYKASNIYIGQLLGIFSLIVLSLIGSLAGNFIPLPYIGLLGIFPIYLGVKQIVTKDVDDNHEMALSQRNMVLGVMMVTIANGGDNIGIYIPLFVTLAWTQKIAMIVIFLLMTLLWCTIAKYLANHPLLKASLSKYGHIVTPIVLILLGLYILYESKTLSIFVNADIGVFLPIAVF